jgi:hypothetical protein
MLVLCVRRYVLHNPRCGDLDGVPSLPATAYTLLRQKFRPITSTLTATAGSKDRTTTKLLIRLQVIWLDYATFTALDVGVLHFGVLRVCDPHTDIGLGGIHGLFWCPCLLLHYSSHMHIAVVSV